MATAGGPNIERDGLVFGFDNGDTLLPGLNFRNSNRRFYRGEPTTNVLGLSYDPTNLITWATGGNQIQLSQGGIKSPVGNTPLKMVTIGNDAYTSTYNNLSRTLAPASAGQTWTISVWAKANQNTTGQIFHFGASTSGTILDFNATTFGITTEWQRFTYTRTFTNASVVGIQARLDGADTYLPGSIIWWDGLQVEQKSYATPLAYGTRSSTNSLIDLTKAANIDVSNVSFDSDGLPTFDGTDDILNTGLFNGRNPTTDPFTIESIVKSDTTSGARMWLDATSNGTNQRLYCASAATGTGNPMGIQNSAWSSSGVQDTNFHHYVIVMDGSTATLYNNGVLHSTKSYSSYEIQALNVGGRAGYYWNGSIPVFKLYDDVLSAQEIQQNYNAYKNRFNI
jgi:hypothetical protein